MPDKETIEKAQADLHEGKSASTAAGEFVREEMDHIREGKHGARSTKQAIAIGLSKARRAGVPLRPRRGSRVASATRKSAQRDLETGRRRGTAAPSRKRSRAASKALRQEGRSAASRAALSRQAKQTARRRRKRR
jgi:hypothetical protein